MARVALIGGTGVYEAGILEGVERRQVVTPYGLAAMDYGTYRGAGGSTHEVAFLARHGAGHVLPPHRINYRANIWALHQLGVRRVIGTAAVGSLREDMPPGHCVLTDSFLDFTRNRPGTFYDGDDSPAGGPTGVVHTDMTEPYCPELRGLLERAAKSYGTKLTHGGCYVCTDGPRFESAAEIRMFRTLGADVVGMTNVPEVVLARELGMCYALVAMVTNYAAGMKAGRLTHAEVVETMSENVRKIRSMALGALDLLPSGRSCGCADVEVPLDQNADDGGDGSKDAGN